MPEHPLPAFCPHFKVAAMPDLGRDHKAFVGAAERIPGGIGASGCAGDVGKAKRHKHGFANDARKVCHIEICHFSGYRADIGVGAMR